MASNLRRWRAARGISMCLALSLLVSCSKKETSTPETSSQAAVTKPAAEEQPKPAELRLPMPYGRYTGDLDSMVKRRNIRALVMLNPIGFFYDQGHPRGVSFEALREFETFANQKLKSGRLRVTVTFIPVRPDRAEAALIQGMGDFIAYGLVVTPERQQLVAFTVPIDNDVKQIVVTGPNFGTAASLEDLGGKEIYVNPLSVNYTSLQRVNESLQKAGKPLIVIKAADKNLLDDDLVQMVNAGLLPATATSAARGKLWSQVLPHLTTHPDLVIASGEQLAWALRKDNPQLKQLLDEFITPRAVGTSFGNTLLRRYLQNTKWVKNATSPDELRKFQALVGYFKKYAGEYDFDYLMIAAQGYQESLLDQSKRNRSGAMGVMQVIPKYAAASPIDISNVITAEGNIEAGVKMLRNIEDQYFNDPKIDRLDKTLFVFASYNAGPNRIARLRKQAQDQGLDPNMWFDNVELVVAQEIGQETVTYVGNVYKYYIAYKLAEEEREIRQKAEQVK